MSDVLLGKDILVNVGGVTCAGQRGASIARTMTTVDTTCKTDYPNRTKKYGWKDSRVTLDGAYVPSDTAYEALMTAYINQSTVTLTEVEELAVLYTATAVITEISRNAPQDGETTFTISLEITGGWA